MAEKDPLVLLPSTKSTNLKTINATLNFYYLKMKSMGDVMGEQQLLPAERLKKVS